MKLKRKVDTNSYVVYNISDVLGFLITSVLVTLLFILTWVTMYGLFLSIFSRMVVW